MSTGSRMQERKRYKIFRNLTAYVDQEEGFALDQILIAQGNEVFADPEYWAGTIWNGFKVVKLTWGINWYYAKVNEFNQSAKFIRNEK
jgi:hypothetical protein